MEFKLVQQLSQKLVMTPQLQMAIKLLQLNRLELIDAVREELMNNPILDEGGDGSEAARVAEELRELTTVDQVVVLDERPADQPTNHEERQAALETRQEDYW